MARTGSDMVRGPDALGSFSAGRHDVADNLPPSARETLLRLRERRDELAAVGRDLADEYAALHAEHRAATDHLHELTDASAAARAGQRPLADDAPAVMKAKAALADIEARRDRLKDRLDANKHRRQEVGQLLDRTETWLKELPAGALKPHAAVTAKPKRGETVLATIERLREDLAQLRADVHEVRSAPYPLAQARAVIEEQVDELARAGRPDVWPVIEHGEPVRFRQTTNRVMVLGNAAGGGKVLSSAGIAPVTGPDTLALFAWMHRDELIARLHAEAEALADDGAALSDVERAGREHELRARILEGERIECALIAQAAGDAPAYRPQTDPRALLALSDELPAPRA
jgi:hypothetical protein